jgi:hypothetical protein
MRTTRAARAVVRGGAPPVTEGAIFSREGEYWTIAYHGTLLRLRDGKGLQYLAQLLRHAGRPFSAAELAAGADIGSEADAVSSEQARSAVTKRIRSAISKIAAHHAGLGYHLTTAVKTGHLCLYHPDPERPITWNVTP